MKSKINFKSLLSGFLIGALAMGTINISADTRNRLVEARIQDATHRIMLDGTVLELDENSHILNYNGRIYTPARLVAEALGAEVNWNDRALSVEIRSPKPEVVEVIVEKEVIVEVPRAREYDIIPTRVTKNDVTVRVVAMDRHNPFGLTVTIENRYFHPVYPQFDDAYLEDVNGNRYNIRLIATHPLTLQGIKPREDAERIGLHFEEIPKDVTELKFFLPIEYDVRENPNRVTTQTLEFITYFKTNN